jgi:hypothetical protein
MQYKDLANYGHVGICAAAGIKAAAEVVSKSKDAGILIFAFQVEGETKMFHVELGSPSDVIALRLHGALEAIRNCSMKVKPGFDYEIYDNLGYIQVSSSEAGVIRFAYECKNGSAASLQTMVYVAKNIVLRSQP